MGKQVWIIVKKELARVFTDRRLVFTTFILPAFSLALIYSIMGMAIQNAEEEAGQYIPTVYVTNMPQDLKTYYEDQEAVVFELISFSEEELETVKDQVRNGQGDLAIAFDPSFDTKVEAYDKEGPPDIFTYYDPTKEMSEQARYQFVTGLLGGYRDEVLGDRLGDEDYLQVFAVDRNNDQMILAEEKEIAGKNFGNLLPLLISILLFAGAMGIGMDAVAGEKERGTLSILLLLPMKREVVAYGKMISLGLMAFASALSSFIGIMIAMPYASEFMTQGDVSLSALKFSPMQLLQLISIMIGLAAIYVGVIIFLSLLAKSVKEAGTYVSPAYILVMVAGFMSFLNPGAGAGLGLYLPIYGHVIAIRKLFSGALSLGHYGVLMAITLLIVVVLSTMIRKAFENEQIIFKK